MKPKSERYVPVCVSLPENLIALVQMVKSKRRDPAFSDTVRTLLLHALASMSYLSSDEKKALFLREA
jgi:hypothetical protein